MSRSEYKGKNRGRLEEKEKERERESFESAKKKKSETRKGNYRPFEKKGKQVVKPGDLSSSSVAAPNEEVSEWKKESSHDFHRGVAQRDPPCSASTDLTTSSLFFPTCLFPFDPPFAPPQLLSFVPELT